VEVITMGDFLLWTCVLGGTPLLLALVEQAAEFLAPGECDGDGERRRPC
jgi:hypothetical protein